MPSNEAATLPFRGFHCTSPVTGPGTSGVGTARGTTSTLSREGFPYQLVLMTSVTTTPGAICKGHNSHNSPPRFFGAGRPRFYPQHLPDRWLDALLEEAELFAPEAWDPQEDDRVHECCAGLLGAVLVVLMDQRGHPDQLDVAVGTLMSHLHCYILALAAERVSRDTDIWLEPPTLANLFDAEREVRGRRRAAEGP